MIPPNLLQNVLTVEESMCTDRQTAGWAYWVHIAFLAYMQLCKNIQKWLSNTVSLRIVKPGMWVFYWIKKFMTNCKCWVKSGGKFRESESIILKNYKNRSDISQKFLQSTASLFLTSAFYPSKCTTGVEYFMGPFCPFHTSQILTH